MAGDMPGRLAAEPRLGGELDAALAAYRAAAERADQAAGAAGARCTGDVCADAAAI